MRMKDVHPMVLEILKEFPETRDSDSELQIRVIEKYFGKQYLNQPYIFVANNPLLPKIESVGRARRRIQREWPELRADADVEAKRMLKEEEFREYAKRVD